LKNFPVGSQVLSGLEILSSWDRLDDLKRFPESITYAIFLGRKQAFSPAW